MAETEETGKGHCITCKKYVLDLPRHCESREHRKEVLKSREKRLQQKQIRLDGTIEYWEADELVSAPGSGVISWSIPVRLLAQKTIFKSKSFERQSIQWQFIVRGHEESFSVGLRCIDAHKCPFVDYGVKLVNRRPLSSVSRQGVELFSEDCTIRGWDFSRALLLESLGFVHDGVIGLQFTINLISEEAQLLEEQQSSPTPTIYSTHAARFLRGWVEENFIPGRVVEQLLRILKLPCFTSEHIPPSFHELKKCDRAFIPNLHSAIINDIRVQYYAITDILRLLLADQVYLEGWHDGYEQNNDTIEHPAHADGFKLLQSQLRAKYPKHKLVFINIFLDEYEQHRMTKKTIYSIEMTIANAALQVQQSISRKYLLCSLPSGVPLNEALKVVVLPSMKLLERGALTTYFGLTSKIESFCGTILSVIGDHMGQCDTAGLKGPSCDFPSRYSLTPRDQLDSLSAKKWRDEDATVMWHNIEQKPTKDQRNKEMHNRGLREKSALVELGLFAKHYFWHFGNCLLHNSLLGGNLERHVLYLGRKYGEKFCEAINEQAENFSYPRGEHKIAKVYYIHVDKETHTKKLKVCTTLAKQLEALIQYMSVWLVNVKMVSVADVNCFVSHIRLYNQLRNRESWSRDELTVNGSLATRIQDVKRQILECFPRDQGYNWKTPKFEALDAWPRLILFLGPPAFQSTETYEASHQPNKRKGNMSNCKNIERDILNTILYAHHQVFYNDNERQQWSELQQLLQNADRNVRQENLCFGRKAINTISNTDKILMTRTSSLLQIDAPKPVRTFECTGFTKDQTRLHLEDYFALSSPLSRGKLYAQLLAVYDFEGNERIQLTPWAKIELYEPTGDKDSIHNVVVKCTGKCLIPLGHGYKILHRIHLCSVGKLFVVNKYCVSIIT